MDLRSRRKLIATPRRMETPDFARKDFALFEVAVEAWGGIYLCSSRQFFTIEENPGRHCRRLAHREKARAQRENRPTIPPMSWCREWLSQRTRLVDAGGEESVVPLRLA